MQDRLNRLWSPVRHLNAVADTEALYRAYEAIDKAGLDAAQHQVVAHALRDFRLGGVNLAPGHRRRFKAIQQDLSRLQSRFEQNPLDATQAWSWPIQGERELSGLPDAARAMLRQTAAPRGESGWLVDLEFPSYHAVVTYAHGRSLREQVYPKTGLRFLHHILERGGSASGMALFKGFRGREPSRDALLGHSGLAA
jgi:oligopeptidase A